MEEEPLIFCPNFSWVKCRSLSSLTHLVDGTEYDPVYLLTDTTSSLPLYRTHEAISYGPWGSWRAQEFKGRVSEGEGLLQNSGLWGNLQWQQQNGKQQLCQHSVTFPTATHSAATELSCEEHCSLHPAWERQGKYTLPYTVVCS